MGRQIGGTIEDLIALGAAVLDVNDAGTPVLSQPEGVIEQLPAQTANIVADPVLNLGLFIYQQNKGLSTCGAISGRNGTRTGVIPLDSFKCEAGVCVCVCVCVFTSSARASSVTSTMLNAGSISPGRTTMPFPAAASASISEASRMIVPDTGDICIQTTTIQNMNDSNVDVEKEHENKDVVISSGRSVFHSIWK